jgi:hypothetical protein
MHASISSQCTVILLICRCTVCFVQHQTHSIFSQNTKALFSHAFSCFLLKGRRKHSETNIQQSHFFLGNIENQINQRKICPRKIMENPPFPFKIHRAYMKPRFLGNLLNHEVDENSIWSQLFHISISLLSTILIL